MSFDDYADKFGERIEWELEEFLGRTPSSDEVDEKITKALFASAIRDALRASNTHVVTKYATRAITAAKTEKRYCLWN